MPTRSTKQFACPVQFSLSIIAGKWKPSILWQLHQGTSRFAELEAAMPGVSHKVLTQQLRELERDGIVQRDVRGKAWNGVDYSLTPFGRTLRPALDALAHWGKENHRRFGVSLMRSPSRPACSGLN
jgi:DNA-binding HxlR family transcriptional regulator